MTCPIGGGGLVLGGPRLRTSAAFTGLLASLRPFGNDGMAIGQRVENYLNAIGVTHQQIAAIRALLIEADR